MRTLKIFSQSTLIERFLKRGDKEAAGETASDLERYCPLRLTLFNRLCKFAITYGLASFLLLFYFFSVTIEVSSDYAIDIRETGMVYILGIEVFLSSSRESSHKALLSTLEPGLLF